MERYLMVLPEVPIAESALLGNGCLELERNMWRQNAARLGMDIPRAAGPRKLKVTFLCNGEVRTETREMMVTVYDALTHSGLLIDSEGMVDIEAAVSHNCGEGETSEATIVELWELPPLVEGCSSGQLDS